MPRSTEDADLLQDDGELRALIDQAGFSEAVEATNKALEARRPVQALALSRLEVSVLGPLDLIASKLCRADDLDLKDIRYLIRRERLAADQVRAAVKSALVPEIFADVYPSSLQKLETILRTG